LRRPQAAWRTLNDTFDGVLELGRGLRPTGSLSIEGRIGPHRRWAVARASLEQVKATRRALGGTVNDVVLAAITGAFRDLLLSRGDRVDAAVVRTLVPVSTRDSGDRTPNNQVASLIAELPVGLSDERQRFEAVQVEMGALKASHEAEASGALTSVAAFTPPMLYALGLRSSGALLRRVPQRSVHTVTTNVPGPGYPLYAAGRRLLEYLPFVPLSQGVQIGVAILSYDGQLRFGVTGDYDAVPEVEWFCRRIEAHVAALAQLAGVDAHLESAAAS
jgi:diacylglycerol O-acyltransferase